MELLSIMIVHRINIQYSMQRISRIERSTTPLFTELSYLKTFLIAVTQPFLAVGITAMETGFD